MSIESKLTYLVDEGPVKRGERPCLDCGKPHDAYNVKEQSQSYGLLYAPQWHDPIDGHAYRPESWESIARRLMSEEGAGL